MAAQQGTGTKKEFLIDSSDSARPAATLQSETKYFSDIKPKKRYLSDVIYEETGETAKTRKGKPVKLILKTSVYNDGTLVTTTVGEENEAYQEFKRTGVSLPSNSDEQTIVHEPSAAVKAARKKALAKKPADKKAADKE